MPCFVEETAAEERARYLSQFRHNSEMADMLCCCCTQLELHDVAIPERVKLWWVEHKKRDYEKNLAEQKQRDDEHNRKAALNKLTPHERELLGLK